MQMKLKRENNVYANYSYLHPTSFRGSLIHGSFALADPEQSRFVLETRMEGKLNGVSFTGQVDCFDRASGTLWDWKTCAKIWVEKLPYSNHEDQIKLYHILLMCNDFKVTQRFVFYIDFNGVHVVPISEPTDKDLAKYKKRAESLQKVMEGKLTAKCEESALCCPERNRNKKQYCLVADLCPAKRKEVREEELEDVAV